MATDDTSPAGRERPADDEFQRFLTEYLARIEHEGSAAIDAFRARHPEFASQLGHQLEWLAEHLWRKKEAMPERVGPLRVMQRLGQGGMGEVFLAEQSTPFKRVVAVKVVRLDKGDEVRVRRFANEAQVLASLNHDGIAKVFDAGVDQGMPWFSMEYVPGKSLTTYCKEEHLGIDARLRLFLDVCRAVEHAHRQGILHRDLKPSNILVYGPATQPVVKVIDFGLAKLMQPDPADRVTQTAQIVGTPDYMSPEQVDTTSPDPVDTRTDVYALGVVLYQLLTGALPLPLAQLGASDMREIVRLIKERQPSSPSVRVEESDSDSDSSPTTATGMSAHALSRELAGDLDSVVMKALAKEVDRRYGSVAQLADDIRRYLRHEPVSSRRWTWSYLLAKFLRRHRTAASFAAVLATVTISAVAAIIVQAIEQARQAERGELFGLARFLDDLLLAETAPPPARPEHLAVLRDRLRTFEAMYAQRDRIRAFLDRPPAGDEASTGWSGSKALEAPQRKALDEALDLLHKMAGTGAELDELQLRIDWATRVQEMTVVAHRDAWVQTCRDIRTEAPYGFDMVPQVGLVPLGRDPDSHLHEFALLLPTGEIPARADNGKLTMRDRTCPVFVLLPGGDVTVGGQKVDPAAPRYDEDLADTEDTVDQVTLPPFFASKFEFTNGQWSLVLAGEHRGEPSEVYDDPLRPVVNLNQGWMQHVLMAWGMSLPTWQEWEYLARGGSDLPYAHGTRASDLQPYANLLDRTARRTIRNLGEGNEEPWADGFVMTAPVGRFPPNGFGLHDVHGNALEPAIRSEPDDVMLVELRGGSWNQPGQRARILFRPIWNHAGMPSIGFRPVITVHR